MTGRWIPTGEVELNAAVEAMDLDESHHTDVKAAIASGDSGNRKLAIDLASFAVDGGLIAVGIAEKGAAKVLRPIPLKGLKERVDQVGRTRVDPPLVVSCREIEADGLPGEGYLIIAIPASPEAPHMVDHIYRGRGDTTNIELSDAEVRRIRAQRAEARLDIRQLLSAEIARDPFTGDKREQAHLFLVAEPVYAPPELLVEVAGGEWPRWLHKSFRGALTPLARQWSPDLTSASRADRTSNGWALRSWERTREAATDNREEDLIELEVNENGGLRIYCARATTTTGAQQAVVDSLVYGLTWRLVEATAVVSRESGFVGNWRLGLAITNLKGAASHDRVLQSFGQANEYSDDDYIATTEATFAELADDDLEAIVRRLTDRLNRTLSGGKASVPTRAR